MLKLVNLMERKTSFERSFVPTSFGCWIFLLIVFLNTKGIVDEIRLPLVMIIPVFTLVINPIVSITYAAAVSALVQLRVGNRQWASPNRWVITILGCAAPFFGYLLFLIMYKFFLTTESSSTLTPRVACTLIAILLNTESMVLRR